MYDGQTNGFEASAERVCHTLFHSSWLREKSDPDDISDQ
jgi:hypothetical protein